MKTAKPAEPKGQTADSLKAAAAVIGMSVSVLQQAKAMGCPAFVHGRVNVDELRKWLVENEIETSDLDGLKIEVLKQDLRRKTAAADTAEMDRDKAKGLLCVKTEVVERITANISRAIVMLHGVFVSQLPAQQGGCPADVISEMNEKALEQIKLEMEKAL